MSLYFQLLDADRFHQTIRPALAAAWRQRSFTPCRRLCEEVLPAAGDFLPGGAAVEASLLRQVAEGLSFDRDAWRLLVGEVLLYSATALPELQTAPESLACLVGLEPEAEPAVERLSWDWVRQAHFGTRDLTFGRAFYRPDRVGYNDTPDVARLAGHLAAVRTEGWRAEDLARLPQLAGEEERAEELDFVRDWLPPLRDMYEQARADGLVVVCEQL